MNSMHRIAPFLVLAVLCAVLIGCGRRAGAPIGAGDDWTTPGGDAAKSHYSTLTDITPGNVGRLGLAWSFDLGTNRVQEATPVVIDGVMYTSGNLGRAYALNAATGEEIWRFEPEVDMQSNRVACCDQANRGVAVRDGKVMVASLDGYLYALNAATGAVVWKVDTIVDRARGYTVTGAPEIAGDLVVIGNAGAEFDVRGYVTAYRIDTGAQVWRFFTIPHDPRQGPQENAALEAAAETWDPHSRWDIGGGGTVWDAIHYDPGFDAVYIGVGNGGPYPISQRSPRGGDNLYLSSVVALDRATGKVRWHFQETPGDSWDYTASQPMILADVEIDGRKRPVILHSVKNGFLFVIDRETGRPLRANALVRTTWTDGYDLATGRPRPTPQSSDYATGPKIVFPSAAGARNWYPPAYDPERGLYFAAVLDMGNLMFTPPALPGPAPHRSRALNAGAVLIFTSDLQAVLPTLPPPVQAAVKALPEWRSVVERPFSSEIRAIDALSGKTVWAVHTSGAQDRNGVLATRSGLLMHGSIDGRFFVRNADTGQVLKEIDTGSSMMAAPMTYRVKGVQYVAIATGFGGGGWSYVPDNSAAYSRGNANRILVFRLDGGAVARPELLPPLTVAPPPPPQARGVTRQTIAFGHGQFLANCAICHSNQPRSTAPDLRRMAPATHAAFNGIVLEGWFLANGMPRWDDTLTPGEVNAIHAYLIDEQRRTRARELQLQRAGKPLDARNAVAMSNY
ncbi:MAG: pyrrolo-quinoline quinone [Alphaproteobacteria bacterium]|nr:MAG: pyrrolo-quinoline quinone [Caulobacteraceae bacterium]TPW08191.1 MAG: pyrrolo-quinoline quinone [Alphaproteobacteria bacterium]